VTRVFIVATSPLARSGLKNLLASIGVSVVGRSATLDALLDQIGETEPDAVLVDATGQNPEAVLDGLIGSDLTSETTLILLMDRSRPAWIADALRAGVSAILPLDVSPQQLASALQAALAGLVVMSPTEISTALPAASAAMSTPAELTEPLTPREREVLQMLAAGLVNKEIASKLSISDHTVKFHVASILGKLGASTRTEAVSLAIRRGLVLL
jgi:two-component system, NarL family, response regulator YdfI